MTTLSARIKWGRGADAALETSAFYVGEILAGTATGRASDRGSSLEPTMEMLDDVS